MIPERHVVVPGKKSVVTSEPVCLPADRPNLFADQICCVEYSSLSCALMLNFTRFEDDARQAVICISLTRRLILEGWLNLNRIIFVTPGFEFRFTN